MLGGEKYRDIDICVVLDKKYSNLEMSRKRVKYLSLLSNKYDLHIFQQLPIYIKIRVLKDGKVLFCRNEDRLYEIAIFTMKEFGSFEKIYNMYLDKVKNGWEKDFLRFDIFFFYWRWMGRFKYMIILV